MVLGFGNAHLSDSFVLIRRPPALLAVSLVAVGVAIAINALFMQPPHPAPLLATRDAVKQDDTVEQDKEGAKAQRSDDLVLAVQAGLRRIGHYTGPLDGVAGPQTQAAISAFEVEAGRPGTGKASLDLLAAIKAARASDTNSLAELAAGLEEEPPAPDRRVAAIQHALAISAYGPLQADGIFGPETQEAILRFQRDHGLAPTGEISDALVVELRAAGALEDE